MKTKLLLSFIAIFLISQITAQELESFDGLEIPITQGTTLADLPIFNTEGFTTIYWSDVANQQDGELISVLTEPVNNSVHYAFQSIGSCAKSLPVKTVLLDVIPAPIGDTPIALCDGDIVTLCELPIFNTDGFDGIYWFSTADQVDGTGLPCDTVVASGITYYAFQGIGVEAEALEVTIEFLESVPAPNGETVQTFCCESEATFGEIAIFNNGEYDTIYWFTTDDNLGTLIEMDTEIEFNNYYYAFQSLDECALSLEVYLECVPHPPAPIYEGEMPIPVVCADGVTLSELPVYNTEGYENIYWFSTPELTGLLDPATEVEEGTTYYAVQDIGFHCGTELAVSISCVTGIEDVQNSFFTISPNPTTDVLNVSFTGDVSKSFITIYDALGKKIIQQELTVADNKAFIDFSKYQSGTYFVQIQNEDGKQIERIVKK